MSTKPIIDAPGTYITRDGRTVAVTLDDPAHPRWRWWSSHVGWHDDAGISSLDDRATDIIAKAPSAPVPASKPRPAKGKKAQRRYVVMRCQDNHITRYTVDRKVTADISETVAYLDSRADARMFAAMKEAQRGGA